MDQYEVSRRPGITLAQALEAEEIPIPELMRFQGSLAWRGTEGSRPARKKGDSAGTSGVSRLLETNHGIGSRQQLEG